MVREGEVEAKVRRVVQKPLCLEPKLEGNTAAQETLEIYLQRKIAKRKKREEGMERRKEGHRKRV